MWHPRIFEAIEEKLQAAGLTPSPKVKKDFHRACLFEFFNLSQKDVKKCAIFSINKFAQLRCVGSHFSMKPELRKSILPGFSFFEKQNILLTKFSITSFKNTFCLAECSILNCINWEKLLIKIIIVL